MSFFGGDETIYVSSVIYQLGEELDRIPDIVKANIIGAGMKSTSRSLSVRKSIIDGLGIKLPQAYAYAGKGYYGGLPQGIPQLIGEASDATLQMLVSDYLTALHAPTAVVVKSVSIELTSRYDTVLRNLIESEYNYDFFEQEVHTSVYGIPIGSTLAYTALPPDDLLQPDKDGWRLTFTKPDTTTVSFDEWYAQSLFDGTASVQNRILYEVSLGGAPAVSGGYAYGEGDARLNLFLRNIVSYQRTTFPAIVLKKNNEYLNTNRFYDKLTHPVDWWKTQPAYKTSKLYGKRMAVDIDSLLTLIKDNPDEKKIDYAFVQPGTIISSPNQCAKEYHFNYFNRLRLSNPDGKPAFDAWYAKLGGTMSKTDAKRCPSQSVHIFDPDTATSTVNMTIAWRYMTYEVITGTLAEKFVIECGSKTEQNATYMVGKGVLKHAKYQLTPMYFRKRLTDSTYAELKVVGLWHENYVYKGKTVQSGVWDAFNDPEGDFGTGFLIPLDIEVYSSLSGRERLQLAQEALHVVFNCYKVVKEKWYETGFFKVVLIIIAVVVIVLSWGSLTTIVNGIYGAVTLALEGAIVSATVLAAVAAVLTALIVVGSVVSIQLIAKEAGEWAAEHWGPVWGAIVSVVVTVVLTLGMGSALGSLGITTLPMTLAQQVIMASSFIFSGLSTYTQFAMEEIVQERAQWDSYVNDPNNPQKQLEKLWEDNFPEMSLPAQMWFAPIENMDDWLTRTLGTGDTLANRLTAHIEYLSEITLTPRLQ